MHKEKTYQLAIYTLATSILLSSVLLSMNQAHSAPTDRDISMLQMEVRNLKSELSNYKRCMNNNMTSIQFDKLKFVVSCR